jgi:hypothetical protein
MMQHVSRTCTSLLHRFWIEFVYPDRYIDWPPRADGVTAYTLDDALRLIGAEIFRDAPLPPIRAVIEDVDVTTLDEKHVISNMDPPNWRGIWYPRTALHVPVR